MSEGLFKNVGAQITIFQRGSKYTIGMLAPGNQAVQK